MPDQCGAAGVRVKLGGTGEERDGGVGEFAMRSFLRVEIGFTGQYVDIHNVHLMKCFCSKQASLCRNSPVVI